MGRLGDKVLVAKDHAAAMQPRMIERVVVSAADVVAVTSQVGGVDRELGAFALLAGPQQELASGDGFLMRNVLLGKRLAVQDDVLGLWKRGVEAV